MSAAELSVQSLSWGVNHQTIIKDISFQANANEVIGIVGPNGAGKTSILKCLYKAYSAHSGDIFVNGKSVQSLSNHVLAQLIAVVCQHNETVFDLTVFDIIHMGLVPHKTIFERDTSEDLRHIEMAATKVDLFNKLNSKFSILSGGEQQRCLIARAIVQRPQLLIMDEPTNHLDVFYQHQILALVKQLSLTLVMSIHDLNLAAQYCDRILLLNQGQVVAFDTPENVLVPQRLEAVFRLPCIVDQHPITQKPRVTFSGAAHV
ncbi:ABC transporter ATP-binding protein [Thalassotalea fusca]